MNLDYDLIKMILEKIEEDFDGSTPNPVDARQIGLGNNFTQQQIEYHLQILKDDNLVVIHPQILRVQMVVRLTAEGHRVLEAMKNEGIWSKIEKPVKELGIHGLKSIASLAIKAMLLANGVPS